MGSGHVTMLLQENCLRVLHNNIQKPIEALPTQLFQVVAQKQRLVLTLGVLRPDMVTTGR